MATCKYSMRRFVLRGGANVCFLLVANLLSGTDSQPEGWLLSLSPTYPHC